MEEASRPAARPSEIPSETLGADLATTGPADTQSLGEALATVLTVGDVLVLTGDLGAGKTCLTQGIGRGLGVTDPITSPTFTLANRLLGATLTLHHLDVYRLSSSADALDLDLPDLKETGVTVIEWGELVDDALGSDTLTLTLRYPPPPPEPADPNDDDEFLIELDRLVSLAGRGATWRERWPALLAALASWLVDPTHDDVLEDDASRDEVVNGG